MRVVPIKTAKILSGQKSILELVDKYVRRLEEKNVLVITSKVVSLCEGRTESNSKNKEQLIEREADYYLPASISRYGYHFTITNHSLISLAGIDESNGGGNYVLWPADAQASANLMREHLARKFGLKDFGVIISDSTVMPMRWGTIGMALAYSGFKPTNNYIGKPDLFGRPFQVSRMAVAGGLAAAAVLAMGEGTERTPMVLIDDVPFVKFQDRNPTKNELEEFYISNWQDDLFEPFLKNAPWQKGKHGTRGGI